MSYETDREYYLRHEIMETREKKGELFGEIEALHERADFARDEAEEDAIYEELAPLQMKYDEYRRYIEKCSDELRDLIYARMEVMFKESLEKCNE